MNTVQKGKLWEDQAALWLEKQEFNILCRNYRYRGGEIDIICSKDDVLHIVEVKHLPATWDLGEVARKVDGGKRSRIRRTAGVYLENNSDTKYHEVSFDVIAIIGEEVNFLEGVF